MKEAEQIGEVIASGIHQNDCVALQCPAEVCNLWKPPDNVTQQFAYIQHKPEPLPLPVFVISQYTGRILGL